MIVALACTSCPLRTKREERKVHTTADHSDRNCFADFGFSFLFRFFAPILCSSLVRLDAFSAFHFASFAIRTMKARTELQARRLRRQEEKAACMVTRILRRKQGRAKLQVPSSLQSCEPCNACSHELLPNDTQTSAGLICSLYTDKCRVDGTPWIRVYKVVSDDTVRPQQRLLRDWLSALSRRGHDQDAVTFTCIATKNGPD